MFSPLLLIHDGTRWLIHKSYKVILLKFAIATGIEKAPMVCLETALHGSRSNVYSLYTTANRVETPMQCQDTIASRVICPRVLWLRHWDFKIHINLLSFNMIFDAAEWKKNTLCCLTSELLFTLHRILQPARAYLDNKVNTFIRFFFFLPDMQTLNSAVRRRPLQQQLISFCLLTHGPLSRLLSCKNGHITWVGMSSDGKIQLQDAHVAHCDASIVYFVSVVV